MFDVPVVQSMHSIPQLFYNGYVCRVVGADFSRRAALATSNLHRHLVHANALIASLTLINCRNLLRFPRARVVPMESLRESAGFIYKQRQVLHEPRNR